MSVADPSLTLKGRLNAAILGTLSTLLAVIGFGDLVRAMTVRLRNAKDAGVGVNLSVLVTSGSIALPDDAKCCQLLRAYARTGTGTKGPLTLVNIEVNTEPAAGSIAIAPNGDLMVNDADAWTALDIDYIPEQGDVVEVVLTASSADTFTIPAGLVTRGVLRLLEAESTAGTLKRIMNINVPLDAKPATTFAALKLSKATVQFAVADAVTTARLKLLVASAIDVNAALAAAPVTE